MLLYFLLTLITLPFIIIFGSSVLRAGFLACCELLYLLMHVKKFAAQKKQNQTFVSYFQSKVREFGDQTAIISVDSGDKYTYNEWERIGNKVGNWALNEGLENSVVCLMMRNKPSYVFIWSGLALLGTTTSLLNTNLKGDPLLHVIKTSLSTLEEGKRRVLICERAFESQLNEIMRELEDEDIEIIWWEDNIDIPPFIEDSSDLPLSTEFLKDVLPSDPIMFIFTSGTTGFVLLVWRNSL